MISIIVPVYNAESYLVDCVESIISQSLKDWELLLIDDGSSDKSVNIIDEYAIKYTNIKAFHFENGGLSAARNRGLDLASGELIMFVDADDMLYPHSIRYLLAALEMNNADFAEGKVIRSKYYKIGKTQKLKIQVFKPVEAMEKVLYQDCLLPSACGKLYRKSLFDELRFQEGILYEDLDIFYLILEKCQKVAYVSNPVYFYRIAPGSIVNSWSRKRLDVLNVTEKIEDYMSTYHPDLVPASKDRRLSANFNMFALASLNHENEEAGKCWRLICDYRKDSLMNKKVRFKNKAGILASYLGSSVFKVISRFFYK